MNDRIKLGADLGEIVKATIRARELVKQILTFSRKEEPSFEPLEPYPVIRESLKLLRASLPTTIEIQADLDPDSGIILADPTKIQQVMVNLCTNALHAMENEKGVLKVRLRRVELNRSDLPAESLSPSGPYIELMISDTGCGMDSSVRERIFEPYFTTKEKGKGTGMGLAMVHGIVKGCGGFVKVESEIGKGSVFQVYFPAVEQNVSTVGDDGGKASLPTGTERILVVDDERVIARLQKESLARLGYRVHISNSGHEALEKFKAAPDNFDLIITDQTMPRLTGAEMAKEILKIRPDQAIILCTGYSSRIREKEAREIGIRAFLMKPVERRDLARVVRKVLDGEYGR